MSAPPMTATLEQFLAARIDDTVLANVANQGRVFEPEQAQEAVDRLMCDAGFYGRIWDHLWSSSQPYFRVDHATYDDLFARVWWERYHRPELVADATTRLKFAKEIRIAREERAKAWREDRERERAAEQKIRELYDAEERERQRVKAERAERQAQESARLAERARLYDLQQARLRKIRKRDDRNLDKAFGPDPPSVISEISKEHSELLRSLAGRAKQTQWLEIESREKSSALELSSLIFPRLVEQISPFVPFHELDIWEINSSSFAHPCRMPGGSWRFRRWREKTEGEEDYA